MHIPQDLPTLHGRSRQYILTAGYRESQTSTSFERELNFKLRGLVGNVFLPEKIDADSRLGRELDIYKRKTDEPAMVPLTQFYIGGRHWLWFNQVCYRTCLQLR